MATDVTGEILLKLNFKESKLATLGKKSNLPHCLEKLIEFLDGVATGQIDQIYSDTISLAAAVQDLDLFAGLSSKLDGTALSFVEPVGLTIVSKAAATETLTLGNAAADPAPFFFGAATHTLVLKGPSTFFLTADDGYGPNSGTVKNFRLDPGAASFDVDLVLWGRTA